MLPQGFLAVLERRVVNGYMAGHATLDRTISSRQDLLYFDRLACGPQPLPGGVRPNECQMVVSCFILRPLLVEAVAESPSDSDR